MSYLSYYVILCHIMSYYVILCHMPPLLEDPSIPSSFLRLTVTGIDFTSDSESILGLAGKSCGPCVNDLQPSWRKNVLSDTSLCNNRTTWSFYGCTRLTDFTYTCLHAWALVNPIMNPKITIDWCYKPSPKGSCSWHRVARISPSIPCETLWNQLYPHWDPHPLGAVAGHATTPAVLVKPRLAKWGTCTSQWSLDVCSNTVVHVLTKSLNSSQFWVG